jgi:hypothetical protein
MNDEESSNQINRRRGYIPAACVRYIERLQRKSNQLDIGDRRTTTYERGMYRATWVIAIAAVLTFGAAVIQAVIFSRQLDAMRDADRTTRESFSAVQRPFVTALSLSFSKQNYGAATPQYWLFVTALENSGNTPTKAMTVTSSVSFDTPIVPDTPPDPAELKVGDENLPMVTDYFIGPHGKIGVDAISLHFKTMEEMAKSRLDFFVYGIARYRDQFSGTDERVTKFCFVVTPFIRDGFADPQNRRLCHHWNCGDKEDCERDKKSYEADFLEVRKSNPNAAVVKRPIPIASIIPFFPIPLIQAQ